MASNDSPRPTSPAPETPMDAWARRLRERMAAGIAAVIVLSFFVMTILAFFYTGDPNAFGRAKDLLLFINPVLGVVIGFYFNKASTEGRAESAENTARVASANAQQAVVERAEATAKADVAEQKADTATQQAAQAQQHADQAVSLLGDVTSSAQAVLSPPAPTGGVLGSSPSPEATESARKRLEEALKKVRDSGILIGK